LRQFIEVKNALLRYYSESQTSQGARLIGFVVALLTFLQLVQVGGLLSKILFIGIFGLTVYIVRSIFRFAVFGMLCSSLISISPKDLKESQNIHLAIHYAAIGKIESIRIYLIFRLSWFISVQREKAETWKGWAMSFFLASVANAFFLCLSG